MSQADPRRELVDRAKEVRSGLLVRFTTPAEKRLSPAQMATLKGFISGMSTSLEKAEARLLTEIDRGARETAYGDCEHALTGVERAARIVDSVLDQRADLRLLSGLQLADRSCLDGFDLVVGDEQRRTIRPPVVVIEPSDGPAMTPPDQQLAVPGLLGKGTLAGVPVPFVYVPRSYVRAPWMMSTLQHEVGHHVDHLFGTTITLRTAPEASLGLNRLASGSGALDGADFRLEHWKNWLPEIVADVWGVVLGGVDYAWTLGLILDGRGVKRFSVASPVYPPAPLRIALLVETLRALGLARGIARLEALRVASEIVGDAYNEYPHYRGDAPGVVDAVLTAPVQSRSIRQVVDPETQDRVIEQVAAAMRSQDGQVELPAGTCVRHLASAARRALDQDPTAAAVIADRAIELSHQIPDQPWVVSLETLAFLREAEYFRPTSLEATRKTWKSPPVQLLESHDRVAFVGATNHQLLEKLREARASRGSPHARLEFFFLSDEALRWLVTPAVDHATLLQRRDDARAAITAYLRESPGPARSWALYLYDRPHFFASYWDWESPQGRVHVSPYVWGLDVGDCPGMDFVRGTTPPHRYLAYVAGLKALRETAGTHLIEGTSESLPSERG